MSIRAVPNVQDPYGYFRAYNRRLLDVMVTRPKIGQMVRAILEGIDRYAAERGVDPTEVDFDARLLRTGRVVVALRLQDDEANTRQWETKLTMNANGQSQESVFQAVGSYILVRVWEPQRQTASGIQLPDSAQESPQVGDVLSVGKKVQEIERGDVIVFYKYAGAEIDINNDHFLVLTESDVLTKYLGARPTTPFPKVELQVGGMR